MTPTIRRGRRLALSVSAAMFVLPMAAPAAAAPQDAQTYDLASENLEAALHDIATASGQTVLAPTALVAGRIAPPLKGRFTAEEAVQAVLAGTGLQARLVGGAVVVTDAGATGSDNAAQLSEVVVSASHIKGAPPATPVQTVSRTDIDRSGYGDVGELMRSLPQSYDGGQQPGVLIGASGSNAGNSNQTNSATVNLRGLGSDATLVLIDGHRLAADAENQAPDISVIPLAAIARVEIVTDGASALYGSDAVAGVANFIMRSDYDGAEISERIGGASEGGDFSQIYSALVGKTWGSGHILASVETSHQSAILASDRDYTQGAPGVNDLLWPQTKTTVFANLGQDLTPWASFHFDGLYAQRQYGQDEQSSQAAPVVVLRNQTKFYFAAPTLDLSLPDSWSVSVQGTASASQDPGTISFPGGGYVTGFKNSTDDVEASANGPIATLPSGQIKLAIGGGYRAESFAVDLDGSVYQAGAYHVTYLYGEAFAPLVSPSADRPLLNALDLSLAGRWERYSDFGSTANPKVGVRYKPLEGLTLRATWGTSFKAPQFVQTSEPANIFLYPGPYLGGPAGTTALMTFGGDPKLKPERANGWTIGADWAPPQVHAFEVSVTYFNIDYTDRIVQPISDPGVALTDQIYAPFVTTDPSDAQQAAAIASAPTFYNETGSAYDPSKVIALVRDLLVNAASQKIEGVDVSIKKSFSLGRADEIDAFVNASWLHILQQTLPTQPFVTLTGTLFNPPNLRTRAGLTWTHGPVSATGIVNYISGETDTGVTPNVPVSAWTTLDLNLNYKVGRLNRWLPDLDATLSVTNALDARPPYARGASDYAPGFNFDSTNASAIGRFVAFQLRERF
jgi:outer membrane receptor protein involved in Fe transport